MNYEAEHSSQCFIGLFESDKHKQEEIGQEKCEAISGNCLLQTFVNVFNSSSGSIPAQTEILSNWSVEVGSGVGPV